MAEDETLPGWPRKRLVRDSRGHLCGSGIRVANAKADVNRLRLMLEHVLDGTIRLEYGWNPEAKAYHYWFVVKEGISPVSYPSRVEAVVAALDSLAANESA